MKAAEWLVLLSAGGTAMAQQSAPGGAPPPGQPRWTFVPMLIESKAFEDGGIVPLKYSFYGANVLPDFRVSNLPVGTQTLAVILHDLDVAPGFNSDDNLHWLAWNIPASGGRPELLEAMKGKVVAKAAYVGRFRNDTNAVRPLQAARPPAQ